jgi:hypothetical protein
MRSPLLPHQVRERIVRPQMHSVSDSNGAGIQHGDDPWTYWIWFGPYQLPQSQATAVPAVRALDRNTDRDFHVGFRGALCV